MKTHKQSKSGTSCGLKNTEGLRLATNWNGVTCKGCLSRYPAKFVPQNYGMRAKDALSFVDGLDLPDGAAMAMASELYGGDYDDFISGLGEE